MSETSPARPSITLGDARAAIRAATLASEADLAHRLVREADGGAEVRRRARESARAFVSAARANSVRSGLIDKFLQEYGLSTAEGVTLMRLAEALLRTPDAATADALIEDKIEAGDWAAHKGRSPFPLVNFSTRALMFTAAWLDDVEAKDPGRRIVAATKALLDRVGEPVIRASIGQAMRIMGEHFVLGETIEEAGRRGRKYAETGYSFSFDMLGEAALTAADAEKYYHDYANAIAAIGRTARGGDPADNPGISVKLSALHPRYEYAKKERVRTELGAKLRALALSAREAGIGFNVDAEEAARLDLSLDLIEAAMRDPKLAGWDGFGVVVQAYSRRAGAVIDWLEALCRETGRRIMVRLVKGAYWDAEIKRAQTLGLESYPVFTRKTLTDVSYLACARKLLAAGDVFFPQFATHNALTAAMVREMAPPGVRYELQRLHGMGEALHDRLVAEGARSRIYAPVGGHRELLPYLVRRLLENGANSSFVNQLMDPNLSIDDVVQDPIEEAGRLNIIANPAIPSPRDLFAGERLSARGFDETDPVVAARLEAAAARGAEIAARVAREAGARALGGPALAVFNPATGARLAEIATADAGDIEAAARAAAAAAAAWAARTDRSQILERAADLFEAQADDLIALAVAEAGKTLPDAVAELREAVDFLRYYAARSRELRADDDGAPLGVVACISPWNFPLAIFTGQVAAALAAGNAVLAKPAEQTPLIAARAVALLGEAGVPADVLRLLPGDGPSVGAVLVRRPEVAGVVFTGSTPTAQAINRALIDAGKTDAPLIAETGGINAMIVDSTALLEQAVADVVASAFRSAGQRCSACRIVFVQSDVADRFNEMLAGAVGELTIGDPSRLETDVGPLIDEEARASVGRHIADMSRTARRVAVASAPGGAGVFISPVAFELAAASALTREVFGPVLHVVRFEAGEIDTVVDAVNAFGFGLTLGVHTRIDEAMERIVERARIGNIYVNRNQIGAVVGVQPFGGERLSGTGPKAGGPHYLHALRRPSRAPFREPSAPEGTGEITLTDRMSAADAAKLLTAAEAAALRWSGDRRRGARLAAAGALVSGPPGEALAEAARLFDDGFADGLELPGPTGESNRLRLRGRGPVLCLGPGAAVGGQIARALAAGCAVIVEPALANALMAALGPAADGECPIFEGIEGGRAAAPVATALVDDDRLAGVAFDGSPAGRALLAVRLAARRGPIIPILSGADAPERYAVERTVTINTTAAGGDVRLLSLPQ